MAEETKKEEVKKEEVKKEEVKPAEAAPVTVVAGDVVEDLTLTEKHGPTERISVNPQGEAVKRPATFAEMGLDTRYEDASKFVPPVAPSNAPQPDSYINGIRTDFEPSKQEKQMVSEAKKDFQEQKAAEKENKEG